MDNTGLDITGALAALPPGGELYAALFIVACKIVTVFVKPPAATSRWATPYRIVSALALNLGWAANRLQVGEAGIMVPRDQAEEARHAVIQAGVAVLPSRK